MPRLEPRDPALVIDDVRDALDSWGPDRLPGPGLDRVLALLWEQFGAALLAFYRRLLPKGETDHADDLVQDLFLQLLRQLSTFELRDYAGLRGWIWKQAWWVFTGWWRRRRATDPGKVDPEADPTMHASDSPRPDAKVVYDDLVANLVARLSRRELSVFDLMLEELPLPEIARRLGINPLNLYVIRYRIRAKLKRLLADRDRGNEP